jgi:hypothetical protein
MIPSILYTHGDASLSRRAFLGGAASVAAFAVLPLGSAHATAALLAGPGSALKRSTYLPLLNSTFQLADGRGGSTAVVLSGIADLRSAKVAGDDNGFSLTFTGPPSRPLPQGIYQVSNPRTRTADLLVVPVNRGVVHRQYEAIVNNPS